MDDGSRSGTAVSKGVDVSHDIVPEFTLFVCRHGKVDVVRVALHLLDLGICDGQTQILNKKAERGQETTGRRPFEQGLTFARLIGRETTY